MTAGGSNVRPGTTRLLRFALLLTLALTLTDAARAQSPKAWKKTATPHSEADSPGEAVEISLRYRDSRLQLVSVRRLKGYRKDTREPASSPYSLKILSQDGRELRTWRVETPSSTYGAPLRDESEVNGPHAQKHRSKMRSKKYSITINLPEGASRLQLVEDSSPIDEVAIPPVRRQGRKLESERIKGSEVKNAGEGPEASLFDRWLELAATTVADWVVGRAIAQTTQSQITLVFVGDQYPEGSDERFRSDVDRVVAQLIGIEPFAQRADAFEFVRVLDTPPLDCHYSPLNERLLVCDESKVVAAVNDADVAYDHIAVLVDSPTYGGSGGRLAVTYNGADAPLVFAHEWGHAFADLRDEYVQQIGDGVEAEQFSRNCYTGSARASQYHPGCDYRNWHRSSSTSIMRSLASSSFNQVSRDLIEERIDAYVGPPSDPPPTPAPPQAPFLMP